MTLDASYVNCFGRLTRYASGRLRDRAIILVNDNFNRFCLYLWHYWGTSQLEHWREWENGSTGQ